MQCYSWFYCYIIAPNAKKLNSKGVPFLDANMHICILGSIFETKDAYMHHYHIIYYYKCMEKVEQLLYCTLQSTKYIMN